MQKYNVGNDIRIYRSVQYSLITYRRILIMRLIKNYLQKYKEVRG